MTGRPGLNPGWSRSYTVPTADDLDRLEERRQRRKRLAAERRKKPRDMDT